MEATTSPEALRRQRAAKTAALLVLSPIFEADLQPEQYAYRPGRGAPDAVRRVHRLLTTGRREVVDADLSDYFGQIPHAALMQSIARRVSDGRLLGWVKAWLEMAVEEDDGRVGSGRGPRKGRRFRRCSATSTGVASSSAGIRDGCASGSVVSTRRGPGSMCASRTNDSGKSTGSRALRSARRAFRGRRHDLVREPDAGNPHIRFDERRLETEPRQGVRHRHRAKAAGNSYPHPRLPPPRQSSPLQMTLSGGLCRPGLLEAAAELAAAARR